MLLISLSSFAMSPDVSLYLPYVVVVAGNDSSSLPPPPPPPLVFSLFRNSAIVSLSSEILRFARASSLRHSSSSSDFDEYLLCKSDIISFVLSSPHSAFLISSDPDAFHE